MLLDKNRNGPHEVTIRYKWYTRDGLRFVPETPEEWKNRAGKRGEGARKAKEAEDEAAQILALCGVIERLSALGEPITERALRSYRKEIGCAEKALPKVVAAAIEAKALQRDPDRKTRGGGRPLVTVEGWRDRLTPPPRGQI